MRDVQRSAEFISVLERTVAYPEITVQQFGVPNSRADRPRPVAWARPKEHDKKRAAGEQYCSLSEKFRYAAAARKDHLTAH
jgi:hypothetical protein